MASVVQHEAFIFIVQLSIIAERTLGYVYTCVIYNHY